MKIRVAPATKRFLESYTKRLPHAVLLTGSVGVGLNTLAGELSSNGRLLRRISPESRSSALPSISAETIRELYIDTRSVLEGKNFVIIDDADAMNHVAQNALLKLLEEPNDSICFILTSHIPDKLLPTIRSRTQIFSVPPIDHLESMRLLKSLGVTTGIDEQRLLYIAQGLPAELTRLTQSQSDFKSLSERVSQARQIVEGTPYQRLVTIASTSLDRQQALQLIEMVILLLKRSIMQRPERMIVMRIDSMLAAAAAIRSNGNVKLHLIRGVLQ